MSITRDPVAVLRTIDKIIFDPLSVSALTCLKRCSSALSTGLTKVGTVYKKDGKNMLLVVKMEEGNPIVEEELDLSSIKVKSLIDNVSQTDLFSNVDSFTEALKSELNSFGIKPNEYTIRLQDSGTKFTTQMKSGQVISACFSFVQPTYFDLCCRLNDKHVVHYSNRSAGPLSHSGDKMTANRLLHTLSYTNKDNSIESDQIIVPFLTGYKQTPLKKFEKHRPVVVIMDHLNKEMIVVRVPLDEASVGDHTLCAPIVGTLRSNDDGTSTIYWAVLLTACVGSGAVPKLSTESYRSLERARCAAPAPDDFCVEEKMTPKHCDSYQEPIVTESDENMKCSEEIDISQPRKSILCHTSDVDTSRLSVIFKQAGVTLSEAFDHRISFGSSALVCTPDGDLDTTCHPEDAEHPSSEVILPCIVPGTLEGGPILAGGTVTEVLKENIIEHLFSQCCSVISVVSDTMTDSARESNPHIRINGVFIVVCSGSASWAAESADEEETDIREMILASNINAATALAGPKSLLLAYLPQHKKLYTLDGVGIPGLIQGPVEPLKDCTREFCSNLKSFLASVRIPLSEGPRPSVVVDVREAKVDFMSEDHDINSFKDLLIQLPVSDLVDNKTEVMDSLAQLRRLYDDIELKNFAAAVITPLQRRMCPPQFKLTEDEMADLDGLFSGQAKKTASYQEARAEATNNKKALRWLVDALGSLVSVRRSGTIGFNIQKLAKQQKVSENVQAALSLTIDSFTELVDENCIETGVVLLSLSRDILKKSLSAVAEGEFISTFHKFYSDDHPLAIVDTAQFTTLSNLTKSWSKHPLSLPAGKVTLGFPSCSIKDEHDLSSIGLPLIDRFAEMQDPFTSNWFTYADWQPIAMMRVVMRNSLANSAVSRSVGKIEPVSKHLGYLLIAIHLETIKRISELQASDDQTDNSYNKMQRSLFGSLICTLSSGSGEPLCNAFNLFGKNRVPSIPKEHEWHVYAQLALHFKHTGWPERQFQYNIAWLLIHWLNVKLLTEVTNAIRGKTRGGKSLEKSEKTKGKIALIDVNKQPSSKNITVVIIGEDDIFKREFCADKFKNIETTESARRGSVHCDTADAITYLAAPNLKQVRNTRTILSYADVAVVLSKDGTIPHGFMLELNSLGLLNDAIVVVKGSPTSKKLDESELNQRTISDDTPLATISQIVKEQYGILNVDEVMSNNDKTSSDNFAAQVFRIFPKVKGIEDPVFALKIIQGSLLVNDEVTFLQTSEKKPVNGTIKSVRSYPTGSLLPTTTRMVVGDFVTCQIKLQDGENQPLTGSFVTLSTTQNKTTDLIQVSVSKVGGKKWLGKGAHVIAVVGGIAAELEIEAVFEEKTGRRLVNLSSPLEGVTMAVGFSKECGPLSSIRIYSSSNTLVMIGTVLRLPTDASSELVSSSPSENISHAKLSLPPAYENIVLGQLVHGIVSHPKIISYARKSILTPKIASAVSKSLLVTKPPPLSVITTLCNVAFGIQQSEIGKFLLKYATKLIEDGSSEESEHKILSAMFS